MKKTLGIILLLLLVFGCFSCASNDIDNTDDLDNILEPLKFSFLKVGKADAIVISQNGQAILIDSGEDDDAEKILKYLKENEIETIKALIITHFDKDHVGGADKIIANYQIENIYVPDYIGHHSEYIEFINSLNTYNLKQTTIKEDLEFNFGEAYFLIEATKLFNEDQTNIKNDNNYSLITTIKYGNNKLLFMADAENERLKEWIKEDHNEDYDLIKIPHHGVYDDSLEALIDISNPKYAVITDSKKNPADKKTIDILNSKQLSIFSTKDNMVEAISNGQNVEVYYK